MQTQETVETAEYDLVFVGAGASTAYVLLALLHSLSDAPPATPWRIAVVERAPDPFTGVPYGGRAARTSLLITPLRDFLPAAERALFAEWLAENKDWVFDEFLAAEGPFSALWWSRHEAAIKQDDFDGLYLPRYTFGEYLTRRTRDAIARAEEGGLATTDILRDDVVSIDAAEESYSVRCADRTLTARRVVLATGSAPILPRLQDDVARAKAVLVDDPFHDMGAAVEQVATAERPRSGERPPHVVVLGANAGTMDMLYQLNDTLRAVDDGTVFTIVSPSGRLPERLDEHHVARPFRAEALEALEGTESIDAVSVYRAAVEDIARGRAAGLSVADTLPPISQAVGRALPRLSDEQTVEFADRWGVELGRHQRRAGWEYCEVVEQLATEGRLRMVPGSFVGLVADEDDQVHVRYEVAGALHRLEPPADVVMNCAGPARSLRHAAPALLAQLVADGVCRLTAAGSGIAVDASLAAAPNLYVMGPLLAGNVVKGSPVWHMEHCGRISAFGTALGSDLARTLQPSGR